MSSVPWPAHPRGNLSSEDIESEGTEGTEVDRKEKKQLLTEMKKKSKIIKLWSRILKRR